MFGLSGSGYENFLCRMLCVAESPQSRTRRKQQQAVRKDPPAGAA